MIDHFGYVMVYVEDPVAVANFFVEQLNFKQVSSEQNANGVFSVQVAPREGSDAHLNFFSKPLARQISPDLNLAMPSLCFGSYDVVKLHDDLAAKGVAVGDVINLNGMKAVNFADNEGNSYAVRQIERENWWLGKDDYQLVLLIE